MIENAIQGIQKHWNALASVGLTPKRKFDPEDEKGAVQAFNLSLEEINGDVQNLVPAKDAKKSKIWNEAISFYEVLNAAPEEEAPEEPAEDEAPSEEEPGEEAPNEEDEQTMATSKKSGKSSSKAKAPAKKAAPSKAPVAAKSKTASAKASATGSTGKRGRPSSGPLDTKPGKPPGFRSGTKQDKSAQLLLRKEGATVAEIAKKMDWPESVVRGTLFRALNLDHGYGIKEKVVEGKPSTFHLVLPPGQKGLKYREPK